MPSSTQPSPSAQLDTLAHAALARATGSPSQVAMPLAAQDWGTHLAGSPGMQLAQDRRFAAAEWRQWPFNLWHQSFLLNQQWWAAATQGIAGVEPHHEKVVAFWARQCLDLFSPGNPLASNPLLLKQTAAESGAKLVRGAQHQVDDLKQQVGGSPPRPADGFVLGRDLAEGFHAALAAAPTKPGSWWPAWQQWLAARSGARVKPPGMGSAGFKPMSRAPGSCVLEA